MHQTDTYVTTLGLTALGIFSAMVLCWLIYKALSGAGNAAKDFAEGWREGMEQGDENEACAGGAFQELSESLLSVRCPICRSPEGVTCNPELPEDMPTYQVDDLIFVHGLRIVKAVGVGTASKEDVLAALPEAELLADQLRKGLGE